MKYYVYVFDKKKKYIAFALSCPDEKTGNRARDMAKRETGYDGNSPLYFKSGVGSSATITLSDWQWKKPVLGKRKQVRTYENYHFNSDHLGEAELDTKRKLRSNDDDDYKGLDRKERYEVLAFMRSVDKALKELTGAADSVAGNTGNGNTISENTEKNQHSVIVDSKRHQDLLSDFLSALNKPGESAPSIIAKPLLQQLVSELHTTKDSLNSFSQGINKKGESVNADTTATKPANVVNSKQSATGKPKRTRQRSPGKYEIHVQGFLDYVKDRVLQGDVTSSYAHNLAPLDVAEYLSENKNFKEAKIESITDRVSRSKAWKNRNEMFKPIYDTATFRNRRNINSEYLDEVSVQKKPKKQ